MGSTSSSALLTPYLDFCPSLNVSESSNPPSPPLKSTTAPLVLAVAIVESPLTQPASLHSPQFP